MSPATFISCVAVPAAFWLASELVSNLLPPVSARLPETEPTSRTERMQEMLDVHATRTARRTTGAQLVLLGMAILAAGAALFDAGLQRFEARFGAVNLVWALEVLLLIGSVAATRRGTQRVTAEATRAAFDIFAIGVPAGLAPPGPLGRGARFRRHVRESVLPVSLGVLAVATSLAAVSWT